MSQLHVHGGYGAFVEALDGFLQGTAERFGLRIETGRAGANTGA